MQTFYIINVHLFSVKSRLIETFTNHFDYNGKHRSYTLCAKVTRFSKSKL